MSHPPPSGAVATPSGEGSGLRRSLRTRSSSGAPSRTSKAAPNEAPHALPEDASFLRFEPAGSFHPKKLAKADNALAAFQSIPTELQFSILSHLDPRDLINLMLLNSAWHEMLCRLGDKAWRNVCKQLEIPVPESPLWTCKLLIWQLIQPHCTSCGTVQHIPDPYIGRRLCRICRAHLLVRVDRKNDLAGHHPLLRGLLRTTPYRPGRLTYIMETGRWALMSEVDALNRHLEDLEADDEINECYPDGQRKPAALEAFVEARKAVVAQAYEDGEKLNKLLKGHGPAMSYFTKNMMLKGKQRRLPRGDYDQPLWPDHALQDRVSDLLEAAGLARSSIASARKWRGNIALRQLVAKSSVTDEDLRPLLPKLQRSIEAEVRNQKDRRDAWTAQQAVDEEERLFRSAALDLEKAVRDQLKPVYLAERDRERAGMRSRLFPTFQAWTALRSISPHWTRGEVSTEGVEEAVASKEYKAELEALFLDTVDYVRTSLLDTYPAVFPTLPSAAVLLKKNPSTFPWSHPYCSFRFRSTHFGDARTVLPFDTAELAPSSCTPALSISAAQQEYLVLPAASPSPSSSSSASVAASTSPSLPKLRLQPAKLAKSALFRTPLDLSANRVLRALCHTHRLAIGKATYEQLVALDGPVLWKNPPGLVLKEDGMDDLIDRFRKVEEKSAHRRGGFELADPVIEAR